MTCYRVKFTFTFIYDYDDHTSGSVSEGTIHMWYVKQLNKDLTIQKDNIYIYIYIYIYSRI